MYTTVDGKRTRYRLTPELRALLEEILSTRRFGRKEVQLTEESRKDPAFAGLRTTLDLGW